MLTAVNETLQYKLCSKVKDTKFNAACKLEQIVLGFNYSKKGIFFIFDTERLHDCHWYTIWNKDNWYEDNII